MKVLLAGGYRYSIYEEACAGALESLGTEVARFSWSRHFAGLAGRVEQRLVLPLWRTLQFERDLLAEAALSRPDVVWVWRGTQVRPQLLRRLKQETGALLVCHNNDDPFSPHYDRLAGPLRPNPWRLFLRSIPEYDIHFAFRPANIAEYHAHGARQVELLPPYFVRGLHRPVDLSDAEREQYGCDLVFVGHYEDDGRAACLRALAERGHRLRLFGSGWPAAAVREIYGDDRPVRPALGEDYVKALCGARLCLSFLSRLNRDTYTRRSFEIPACGQAMVSERTPDLQALFREGEEAAYFSGPEELVEAAAGLLADDAKRRAMGRAARRRCQEQGFDAHGRMRRWLEIVNHHPSLRTKGGANVE